jgi:hypothetical protein
MSIDKTGISGMTLSFTSVGTGLNREKMNYLRNGNRKLFIDNPKHSYMFSRSNITIDFKYYDDTKSIKYNLKFGLQYLLDEGFIKEYKYHQGIVSLTHYLITYIPTNPPLMDRFGCRESESMMGTRFSIVHKFKIGANRELINHISPTAHISKSLASLHKINILSKASNSEIKAIFSLRNSTSRDNRKFIKNLLHYRITSLIIDESINNILGKDDE